MQRHRLTKINQSGFGIVEVLLIVLVIAALAGTSYVAYQRLKNTNAKNSAVTSQHQATKQPVHTTTQYFTIKEWGVRAPYSGSLKLSYILSSTSSGGGSASFSSDQLSALSSDCIGKGGAIVRYAPTDYAYVYAQGPTVEQVATQNPNLYKHLGIYYYIFRHAQSACGDLNTTATLQAQTNNDVNGLVANLQVIPPSVVKIPELGIQITVPDDIKDLTYKIKMLPSKDGTQGPTAYFSTASLTAADPNCGTDFGPLGALSRINGQYPSSDPNAVLDYGHLVKQFPSFYIVAGFPNASCTTKPIPQETDKGEFEQAESTIQQLN